MASYVSAIRSLTNDPSRHKISAGYVLGIEKFLTRRLTEEYKARRDRLVREVLGNFRRQERLGRVSVSRLARVSAENSEWARERARVAALLLQQDLDSDRSTGG